MDESCTIDNLSTSVKDIFRILDKSLIDKHVIEEHQNLEYVIQEKI